MVCLTTIKTASEIGRSSASGPTQVGKSSSSRVRSLDIKHQIRRLLLPNQPTSPQPGSPQGARSAEVEVPKPSYQQPSITEIDKQAGALYEQKRFADAAPLYDQACNGGGRGVDCKRLGSMYEHGDGVRKDYSQAATLYSKSCIAGDKSGCDVLIIPMYMNGTITEQDASRAEIFFSPMPAMQVMLMVVPV